MIAIVDYGVGNLFSLKSSLEAIGAEVEVTGDTKKIENADKIILPGVGAFEDAAKKLRDTGLDKAVIGEAKKGKPIMGLIKGEIRPISEVIPKELKIPHIGWNALHFKGEKSEIFKYIAEGDFVYFVHSYYGANCEKSVIATAEYGAELTAAVADKNVYGCQFHPEKSGEVGLNILRGFCEIGEK